MVLRFVELHPHKFFTRWSHLILNSAGAVRHDGHILNISLALLKEAYGVLMTNHRCAAIVFEGVSGSKP